MARPKKNGTYLNVCIETSIFEKLEHPCIDVGQTKTVVTERALTTYFNDYADNQNRLKELDSAQKHSGKEI